jgi:hypothetical protein
MRPCQASGPFLDVVRFPRQTRPPNNADQPITADGRDNTYRPPMAKRGERDECVHLAHHAAAIPHKSLAFRFAEIGAI